MDFYESSRMQESQTWADGVNGLPAAAVADELISRAHAVVEGLEEGPRRDMIAQRLFFLFDPQAAEQFRIKKAVDQVIAGAEALTAEEADISEFKELLLEEFELDDEDREDEEDDYWLQQMRAENQAHRAQARALGYMARIDDVVSTAEFGINFGETPNGHTWGVRHTLESVGEVMWLQDELHMPIAVERLRELIIQGLDEQYDTVAVDLLIKLAEHTDDYEAFEAAGERYKHAIATRQNIMGLQGRILRIATHFIEEGEDNDDVLNIALEALAHSDPTILTYPFDCARLGLALQKVA